jgi:hypothetical protein
MFLPFHSGGNIHGSQALFMKAAAQVFERVMLFAVGVLIFIACYAIFMNYQSYFIEISIEDQLDVVGNHITTNIIIVAEKQNMTETRLSIKIPSRVGNEPYSVELSDAGLNITTLTTQQSKIYMLYGLNESFILGGDSIVSTSVNEILIYKKGNRIILL